MSIPSISWQEFALWILRRRQRVSVINRSMLPTLRPGDEILYQPASPDLRLHQGDLVITRHPSDPQQPLIKRIYQIHPDHQFDVRGDNVAESIDSRHFGLISRSHILGKVTCLFSSKATIF